MPGPIMVMAVPRSAQRAALPKGSDIASDHILDAEKRLRRLLRWRRNPRHEDKRWAHLLPPDEFDQEDHSDDRSESITPVLGAQQADMTIGQTGQSSRQRSNSRSEASTPKGRRPDEEDMHKSKPEEAGKPEPAGSEREEEDKPWCYYSSWEFKDKVTVFFDDPMSSQAAYVTSIVVMVAILISVISIMIESLPELEHYSCCKDTAFLILSVTEGICVAIFTVEYGLRLYAARDKCRFMRQPMNVVDLVAIIPFYLELVASSLGSISILRLFRLVRVFRVFKLSKHNKAINVCFSALYESRAIFGLMLFLLAILCVVFASFAFNFEDDGTDPWGAPTPFVSIPAAMWWCIVTVMMVGYGDMIPTSIPGKICAACCIVVGIMVMALPISVIGTNFSQAWDDQKRIDAEAAEANQPVDKNKLSKAQEGAHSAVKLYNCYSRRQIDNINSRYTDKMLTTLAQLWRCFKARIAVLSREPEEHVNQACVRKHYFEFAQEEQQYNSDMEMVKQVCDAGLIRQFERAQININWVKTCMTKANALSKDVAAMHTETGMSNRLKFDAWNGFKCSKAWARALVASHRVIRDFRVGMEWEVISTRFSQEALHDPRLGRSFHQQ